MRLFKNWRLMQRQIVEDLIQNLVLDVGRPGKGFMEKGTTTLQFRVPATSAEEAMVGGTRDDRCEHGMGLVLP